MSIDKTEHYKKLIETGVIEELMKVKDNLTSINEKIGELTLEEMGDPDSINTKSVLNDLLKFFNLSNRDILSMSMEYKTEIKCKTVFGSSNKEEEPMITDNMTFMANLNGNTIDVFNIHKRSNKFFNYIKKVKKEDRSWIMEQDIELNKLIKKIDSILNRLIRQYFIYGKNNSDIDCKFPLVKSNDMTYPTSLILTYPKKSLRLHENKEFWKELVSIDDYTFYIESIYSTNKMILKYIESIEGFVY